MKNQERDIGIALSEKRETQQALTDKVDDLGRDLVLMEDAISSIEETANHIDAEVSQIRVEMEIINDEK